MTFDRTVFFDAVRDSLFGGELSQRQVEGMNDILDVWEWIPSKFPAITLDLRWLGYILATTYHETAQEMWPIEEYGKGEGMAYGVPDPETGELYYGRGDVMLTWADNYRRADEELGFEGEESTYLHPELQLEPVVSAKTMFKGMYSGWFRSDEDGPQTLPRYFNDATDDPYNAREIINGDRSHVPSWSNGVSIGKLIEGYHDKFLDALEAAKVDDWTPPGPVPVNLVISSINAYGHQITVAIHPVGAVEVHVDGEAWQGELA